VIRLRGEGVSDGRACAPVVLLDGGAAAGAPPQERAALDTASALAELERAVRASDDELEAASRRGREELGADAAAILEAQRLILADPELMGPIRDRIAEQGRDPAEAVVEVSREIADEIARIPDDYLQQRAADVVDAAQIVVGHLRGRRGGRSAVPAAVAGGVIVAARDLTPLETISLDRSLVRGLVTELGARNSHVAILARQMSIPAVVGVDGLLDEARAGRRVAIDGASGECIFDPRPELAERFDTPPEPAFAVIPDVVATDDGTAVEVLANAASADEVAHAVALGADGIGLYRTEFMFFESGLVDEERQLRAYCEAAEAADGRRIVIRTLDVGGDKPLPGSAVAEEDNPFLGVRGIRYSLRHGELFATQLRALARAAERFPNLEVMVPMVSGLEELDATRELLGAAGAGSLHVGAMIEVPSSAVLAAEIARETAFLSVGTNDLTQYVLAVDRTNPGVGELYSEVHPAVVRMLATIARAATAAGVTAGVCGELAGRAEAAPLLVGLGYRSLSVAPPFIGRIKSALAGASMDACRQLAGDVLAASRLRQVEELLTRNREATAP
jgi:phosphoenolpyruvate-protein phosphotransferase